MFSRSLLNQLTSKPKKIKLETIVPFLATEVEGGRYFAREKGLHCYPNISKIPKIKIPGRIARSYIRYPSSGAQLKCRDWRASAAPAARA